MFYKARIILTIRIMYGFDSLIVCRLMRQQTGDVVYQSLPEIPRRAFTDPDSYFHNYAKLSKEEVVNSSFGKKLTG